MAIKIETQKTEIPVVIGKLEFTVDASDESSLRLRDAHKNLLDEIEAMKAKDSNYEADFEQTKEVLKKSYDIILGDGAFDKLYEQTASIHLLSKYFMDLANSLTEELSHFGVDQSQKAKLKKYMKKS
ncbi:hypothetical protein [Halalkalibacter sp. APA_J-10(15)]|uniref:hypothetical protein n=1 Tax=unclassified Halalkalibacter TaxID=2893063 RepID=UPI001FF3E843|nr:hypothetical protein [Halalkalibacter sp. APA_J-10(15)]MCK0473779.1 hypothetical protein [Halalkalibacter sp. APA_J-10(15)]